MRSEGISRWTEFLTVRTGVSQRGCVLGLHVLIEDSLVLGVVMTSSAAPDQPPLPIILTNHLAFHLTCGVWLFIHPKLGYVNFCL